MFYLTFIYAHFLITDQAIEQKLIAIKKFKSKFPITSLHFYQKQAHTNFPTDLKVNNCDVARLLSLNYNKFILFFVRLFN